MPARSSASLYLFKSAPLQGKGSFTTGIAGEKGVRKRSFWERLDMLCDVLPRSLPIIILRILQLGQAIGRNRYRTGGFISTYDTNFSLRGCKSWLVGSACKYQTCQATPKHLPRSTYYTRYTICIICSIRIS